LINVTTFLFIHFKITEHSVSSFQAKGTNGVVRNNNNNIALRWQEFKFWFEITVQTK